MWHFIRLITPILLPSWRFFKTVEPSPRLEWCLLDREVEGGCGIWHAFRPEPGRIAAKELWTRLIWNPERNDDLYLISCAERLVAKAEHHALNVLRGRVNDALAQAGLQGRFMFRVVFLSAPQGRLQKDVLFQSQPFAVTSRDEF